MVKLVAELAPAKINLFLRIVGRRADGYHELDSVFLPIAIYDRIGLELRPESTSVVRLRCDRAGVPAGDRNLAVRAARAFMKEFAIAGETQIDLHKQIPVGAGLGGGSSDAGTVLRMMAALHRCDDPARLKSIALSLGADVPFFLNPRAARVGGIGERIAPLESAPKLPLVIAVPPFEVLTADVFRELRPEQWSGAAAEADLHAIARGQVSAGLLVNDLAETAARGHPEIAKLKAILRDLGARAAQMTGSGGAVFGVFDGPEQAARAADQARVRAPDSQFIATSSL